MTIDEAVEAAARAIAEYDYELANASDEHRDMAHAALTAARVPEMLAVVEGVRRLREAHPSANTGSDLDLYAALARYDKVN